MSPWFSINAHDWALSFLSILFEGAPFLLLGALISGAVAEWMPGQTISSTSGGASVRSLVVGCLAGTVVPICECGSVVVIRRLLGKGLPLPVCVAYMLAAPIISPIVALSTLAAFRDQQPLFMTGMRLVAGFVIAFGFAIVVRRFKPEELLKSSGDPKGRAAFRIAAMPGAEFAGDFSSSKFRVRLQRALAVATSDFLSVASYLVAGAAVAALFNTAVNQHAIQPLAEHPTFSTVFMMTLAAGLSLCSTSDAFIAASFVHFPAGAKLAFLVFGPLFDVKLAFLYQSIFRRSVVFWFAVALFVVVAIFGSAINLLT
jgi:uncharacterized membrane protein YraQ (UPF0718 family)